ncbi:MAG: hypothetical protein EPN21_12735 [Methylococcaceae bacterium]|nr:MAG: hypothetical protein EPN21_12735 [Methylococcaceae bacterium]
MSRYFKQPKFCAVWLLIILQLGLESAGAQEPSCTPAVNDAACDQLGATPDLLRPERVLIVPLLHKSENPDENERWPENPAAGIARFYRNAYQAQVEWLRDIRIWPDYYRQIDRLTQQSATFDRVILIGHGGFDGLVLNAAAFRAALTVKTGVATLSRGIESQPGLQESVTITYDVTRNPAFSHYIAERWQDMLKPDADPVREAEALEARMQPPHQNCVDHCRSDPATGGGDRNAACDWVCRDPLFSAESIEKLAPERFLRFADGLRKLVAEGGLIVISSCNPGTIAKIGDHPGETEGMLVHSALAGGAHPSYVHLLAAATGRGVAGPIGKIGADDMTAFIAMLESHRPQRQLRLVVP